MFRELARIKQKMTHEECVGLLKSETRGVLSVNGDEGYPYGMPMNHLYNDEDACIYFHSGKKGHRNDSILKNNKACFCVYDKGVSDDGDWALNVRSVVVFGKIDIITDKQAVTDISRRLSYKFTSDEEYIEREIKSYAESTVLLRLIPENICGKRVKES